MKNFTPGRLAVFACTLLLSVAAVFTGCSDEYDDSELWKSVNDLKDRIEALETKVNAMNSEIEAIRKLIDENVSVVKVTDSEDGNGYVIHFSDNTKIEISHGRNGSDGNDGVDAPVIGIEKYTDGVYYWTITVNGVTDWLLDGGDKLPVTGADGSNGNDGNDGQDGITPVISIDGQGYWQVSYDGGTTFSPILDENGDKVSAVGENSSIGSLFRNITVDGNYAYFELANGTIITVPVRSDFYMLISRASEVSTFVYGEVQEYKVEEVGVNKTIITKPDGWKVTYADRTLTIQAPAETHKDYADLEGTVAVIYFGSNGMSDVVSMDVVVEEDYLGVTPGTDFSVEVTALTHNSVTMDVTPANKTQYWYAGYGLKERIDAEGTGYLLDGTDGYLGMLGFYEVMEWLDMYAKKGDAPHSFTQLTPGTEYYAVIFGFECPGNYMPAELKTEVLLVPFKTKQDVVINSVYRIDVSDVTWNGARYVCISSDDIPYLHGFATKEDFDSYVSDEEFMKSRVRNIRERYWRDFESGMLTWDDFTSTGTQTVVAPIYDQAAGSYEMPLLDDTEYITYAFSLLDAEPGSPLSKTGFKTGRFTPSLDCTFEITTTVERQDVEVTIVPSNMNVQYYFSIDLRSNYYDFDSDLQYAVDDMVFVKWWAGANGYQLPQLLSKGDATETWRDLYAATGYIVCVYGLSEDGTMTTHPVIQEFVTRGTIDETNAVVKSGSQVRTAKIAPRR